MRILFVDHDRGRSGATVSLQAIVHRFKESGCDCTVLSSKCSEDITFNYDVDGISTDSYGYNFLLLLFHFSHIMKLNISGFLLCMRNVKCFVLGIIYGYLILRRIQPSVVVINEYVSIHLAIPCLLLRIPAVVYVRSLITKGNFGIRKGIVQIIMRRAVKTIVCISIIEKQQLENKIQLKTEIVREFIPNWDLGKVDPISVTFFKRPGSTVILNLCGISEIKGTMVFINAMNTLINRPGFSELTGLIAGPIEQSDLKYTELALTTIRNNDHLQFINEQINVATLFKIATIVVVSNTSTHFSRPMIEAWTARKPVVVSDTAHNQIDVVDKVNGCIYRKYDSNDLADTLSMLLQDPILMNNISQTGHAKALSDFDNEHNLNQLMKVISHV